MHGTYERRISEANKIQRNIVQGTAKVCSPFFGKSCKAIHEFKTAEWLAEKTGCSVRAAAYQLSGEQKPSQESIAFIINVWIGREQP